MSKDKQDEDLCFTKDKNYKFVFCRSCGNEMSYSPLIICSDCLGDEVDRFHKAATQEDEYDYDIAGEWSEVSDLLKQHNSKLDIHISGDILWIDNFEVAEGLRRQGVGSILVRAIEKAAKDNGIKRIRLWAADTGHGRSNDFWYAMGYDYDESEEEGDKGEGEGDETDWYMSKLL
jgi:GNAT superfamily N-acetyltransferase